MAEISVEHLSKRFAGAPAPAVDDVSFTVSEGEMLVLLGPSGCGKTTTLRCIAGLEDPEAGVIRFDERTIFDRSAKTAVAPHRRGIGLVFQSFALWPHMTAGRNIDFPLRAAKTPREEREAALREVANLVELDAHQIGKRPGQLSGGQQQRVALARALVGNRRIVLFDEPLSNLDAHLREQLRIELHALHRRVGFTGVYVTHDLTEAVALGDRIAVMQQGRVVQLGTPQEVFEYPQDVDTAKLLGLRKLCTVIRRAQGWHAEEGGLSGALPPVHDQAHSARLFTRNDRVQIAAAEEVPAGRLRVGGGTVEDVAYVGGGTEVAVRHPTGLTRVITKDARGLTPGDPVAIEAALSDIRCYDEDGRLVPTKAATTVA